MKEENSKYLKKLFLLKISSMKSFPKHTKKNRKLTKSKNM